LISFYAVADTPKACLALGLGRAGAMPRFRERPEPWDSSVRGRRLR
jgi:hypothetical protein